MAKTVPLPEGVIQDPATKKVQCTLCHSRDPHSKGGSWMHKGSMGGHLQSEYHKTQALRLAEEVEREERQAQKLRDTYTQPSVQPNATFQNPSHQSRPEMFAPDLPPMDIDTGFNYNPHESFISVDMGIPLPDSRESIEEALKDQFALLMEQAEYRALFGDGDDDENDITVSDLSDHLRRTGFGSEDDNIGVSESDNTSGDPAYAPYPNQTSMFLDLLDNLPRLRISSAQLRFLLFILRSLGVKNTPSYDAFRKMQKELNDKCGNPTTAHTSTLGNKFYVNDIRQTVSRTISNPELAPHLQFYPEETEDGSVSEVWQARRWQEFDPSDCTPMYSTGLRQFFINEVSQLSDDRLVIAQDWVIRKGKLTAACRIVSLTSEGWRISNALDIVPATSFRYTTPELDAILSAHVWADPNAAPPSINPLRELAGGEDLYTVFEPIWSDDVSGNKSKQYNKHMNFYGSCANLPGQLLQQEFCVDFISTSPNASTAEQFSAIRDQIKDTHKNPIRCYNAATHRWCRIRIMIPSLPADNPQQSEESSHIGGNGNLKCRKCKMGGNYEYAESNEGFHAYHYAGILRTAKETRDELYKQLETATHGVKKAVADRQKETGVKDKVAQYWIDILLAKCSEMRKENPQRTLEEVSAELMEWLDKQPGDKVNPLLDLAGLDPTQDTPVEILHTILLGIIKYVWHMLHTSWSDADQALFAIRLQSTDLDGLTVPPIRAAYMMQYRKSLIGKHFKTLMQTMPFHVHDICTPEQFQLVQAVGALGSVLWVGEIKNMETYLADLEVLIGNVLDAFDAVDPSKMITKIKLHLLPHLIQDIRRFGPAVRNSTEIYECYNAIFRLCSILSNHQAPSRDISIKFSSIARIKHIFTGGYWVENGLPVQAGWRVLEILKTHSVVQRHLGWVPPKPVVPGFVRSISKAKEISYEWADTLASAASHLFTSSLESGTRDELLWKDGISVTSHAGDACSKGSWVFARSNGQDSALIIGRIVEILICTMRSDLTESQLVTLDLFTVGKALHTEYKLPVLQRVRTDTQVTRQSIRSSDILFRFSAQHDCRLLQCQPTALRPQLQEREETTKFDSLIAHADDDHYVINLYGLHNASLLRDALARTLVQPVPLFADRTAQHVEMAQVLRMKQMQKREVAAKKRQAKAKKGKEKETETHEEMVENADEIEIESEDEEDDDDENIRDNNGTGGLQRKRRRK